MIELQFLNYLLEEKSFAVATRNGITEEYFISYSDEFKFIKEHFKKYNTIPDKETFLEKFDDFDIIEVTEPEKYLVETLQEEYLYVKMVPFVRNVAEQVKTDSRQAIDYVRTNIDKYSNLVKYNVGYDLISNSNDRKEEFRFRNEKEGLLGISTGINELDNITHGWLDQDFIVIGGRSNEGKTWVLLYFLIQALNQGKKVLFYTGEMSKTLIGFRFDTLYNQFNNLALMRGDNNLGVEKNEKTKKEYYEYLDNLSNNGGSFIVVTPKDIGKRLDVNILERLIEQEKPDIVGIDQLSLMDDVKNSYSRNEKYGSIASDLYLASEKYSIPILSPVQVNREAEKGDNNEQPPTTTQIYGSDGILHNCTRLITIRLVDKIMKFGIRKNRYGLKDQEIMLVWDINHGIVKPFLKINKGDGETRTEQLAGEDLF
jgi:replicative DNA helicase